MIHLGLATWLVFAAALFVWGLVAAAVGMRRGGAALGILFILGGATVALAALVRYAVLPEIAVSTLLIVLVLGGVLLLATEAVGRKDGP